MEEGAMPEQAVTLGTRVLSPSDLVWQHRVYLSKLEEKWMTELDEGRVRWVLVRPSKHSAVQATLRLQTE